MRRWQWILSFNALEQVKIAFDCACLLLICKKIGQRRRRQIKVNANFVSSVLAVITATNHPPPADFGGTSLDQEN